MFPMAHAALASAFNRRVLNDSRPEPALAGSLVPDVIDKTLAWGLRLTGTSHHVGHTPLAGLALTLAVGARCGAGVARSFGAAYLLHLVTDEVHHGKVPWFLPFSGWKRRKRHPPLMTNLFFLALEVPCMMAMLSALGNESHAAAGAPVSFDSAETR